MNYLLEFPLEAGGSVLVEIPESESEGVAPASKKRHHIILRASETLEAALDDIKPHAEALLRKIRSISELPDEISVEFGLKLTVDAGAIVASAGTEVHYIVTLKWNRQPSDNK